VFCYYSFFDYKWNFLIDKKRNLNFNGLDLSIVDFDLLILYTISIGRNWYFPHNFIRNSSLNFYFNWLLSLNYSFNNLFDLYCLYYLLILNDWFLHDDLNNLLDDLNHNVRHWNLYYLKYGLLNYNYLLYDFRNFHYFFNDPRNNYNFLNNSFHFNHTRHLNNLLNNFFYNLLLNPYNFLLYDYWNWSVDLNLFDHLLLDRN
jgi:hypothetical protein